MSRSMFLLGLAATQQLLAGVEGMQCQKYYGHDFCKENEGCCHGGTGCFAHSDQISVCLFTCPATWGCSRGHTCQAYENYLLCKGNEGCCPSGTQCQAYSNEVSACMASCPPGWACNTHAPGLRPQPGPQPKPQAQGFVKNCGPFKVNAWIPEIQITYENGKVQGRDAIQFTVTFPSNGNGAMYASLGFDRAGTSQMPGLDVMTVDSETKDVQESAVLQALAAPPKDPKQDSTLVSHSKVGGKTMVKFYRLMDTGNDFVLRPGLKVSIGWAYGPGSVFAGTMSFHDEYERLEHTMGRC